MKRANCLSAATISETISQSGGSCHFDFIVESVSKVFTLRNAHKYVIPKINNSFNVCDKRNGHRSKYWMVSVLFAHSFVYLPVFQLIKPKLGLSRSANLKKCVSATLARDRGEDSKAFFMVKLYYDRPRVSF